MPVFKLGASARRSGWRSGKTPAGPSHRHSNDFFPVAAKSSRFGEAKRRYRRGDGVHPPYLFAQVRETGPSGHVLPAGRTAAEHGSSNGSTSTGRCSRGLKWAKSTGLSPRRISSSPTFRRDFRRRRPSRARHRPPPLTPPGWDRAGTAPLRWAWLPRTGRRSHREDTVGGRPVKTNRPCFIQRPAASLSHNPSSRSWARRTPPHPSTPRR